MTTHINDGQLAAAVAHIYADAVESQEAHIHECQVDMSRLSGSSLETTLRFHDGTSIRVRGRGEAGGIEDRRAWAQFLRSNNGAIISVELGDLETRGHSFRSTLGTDFVEPGEPNPVVGRAMTRISELLAHRDQNMTFLGRNHAIGPRPSPPPPEPIGPTAGELGKLQTAMVQLITNPQAKVTYQVGPLWQIVWHQDEMACGKAAFDVLITMGRAALKAQEQIDRELAEAQARLRRGGLRRRKMVD